MTSQEAQALVDQGIQQLTENPDQWKQWADTMAQFPKYSPGNALLIMQQRPDATLVMGYRAWQTLDRHVMRGEHGITIIAPMLRRVTDEDAPEPSSVPSASQRVIAGFKAATVFDISQTDGKALDVPRPQELRGEAMRELLNHVIQNAIPVPVRFGAMPGGAYGVWEPAKGQITIRSDIEPNHQFKTLLHEWSHAIGVPDASSFPDIHRGTEEVTAETTAYVTAKLLGLDTSDYSTAYVGHWSHGDPQQVIAVTQAVGQRVHQIVQTLEAAASHDPVIAQTIAPWSAQAQRQETFTR
ncbi:hypothetical protein BXT84_00575 [Sulfobacillus thermotolerans]|uniref:N-terminal domain-containing protein n=1 Tax=Sulfobacillus thermotolerans TaxID=338644 RepID=A0ABM6RMQ2_9FIRM|nr:hypothetical protein BXT84_00575 [Sulfobacillus thermotolerans]